MQKERLHKHENRQDVQLFLSTLETCESDHLVSEVKSLNKLPVSTTYVHFSVNHKIIKRMLLLLVVPHLPLKMALLTKNI